jgi:predicted nuclease of restriction endonuclease-like (RecB) superfamily
MPAIFLIPWGHQKLLIDKCKFDQPAPCSMCEKHWKTTGRGICCTLNPYNFDFLRLCDKYDEKEFKDALMANTESFLLELAFNVFVSLHKRSSAPQRRSRSVSKVFRKTLWQSIH